MKIVLTTHGELAFGLLDSYKMIAGNTDNIVPVILTDDGIGPFSEKLRETLDSLSSTERILILCDIKGGTPYNESLKYKLGNDQRVEIVAGVNLPMLMESGLSLSVGDLNQVKEIAIEAGISAIKEQDDSALEDDYDLEF